MACPTYVHCYFHLLFLHGDLPSQTDEEFLPQSYLNRDRWLDPLVCTVTFTALLFLHGDLPSQTDEEFASQSYLNQH